MTRANGKPCGRLYHVLKLSHDFNQAFRSHIAPELTEVTCLAAGAYVVAGRAHGLRTMYCCV